MSTCTTRNTTYLLNIDRNDLFSRTVSKPSEKSASKKKKEKGKKKKGRTRKKKKRMSASKRGETRVVARAIGVDGGARVERRRRRRRRTNGKMTRPRSLTRSASRLGRARTVRSARAATHDDDGARDHPAGRPVAVHRTNDVVAISAPPPGARPPQRKLLLLASRFDAGPREAHVSPLITQRLVLSRKRSVCRTDFYKKSIIEVCGVSL